jgi:hypothetical protein
MHVNLRNGFRERGAVAPGLIEKGRRARTKGGMNPFNRRLEIPECPRR